MKSAILITALFIATITITGCTTTPKEKTNFPNLLHHQGQLEDR